MNNEPTLDLKQVAQWVRQLCPRGTPGQLWVGSRSTNFRGAKFDVGDVDGVCREVQLRDPDPGVFLRMTTIRPEAEKRGTLQDSVALFALWADIDIAGPGHKHDPAKYEGRTLPPDVEAAAALVEHLPKPSYWVHSGGGLYPLWLPYKPWLIEDQPGLAKLSEDLQQSIHEAARQRGLHYGLGIGDLARVLRIPGTVNRKEPGNPRPCKILAEPGWRYSYDDLRSAIPEVEVEPPRTRQPPPRESTRLTSPRPAFESGDDGRVGPLDDFARRNDLEELLVADGWQFCYQDSDGRRHMVRPGKSRRDNPSGNVYRDGDRQVLYVFSDDAGFPVRRGLSPGDWYAWRHHGGDLRAAAQALRAQGYGDPLPPREAKPPSAGLPAPVDQALGDFWDQRPVLRAIAMISRARLVGPWAVLGGVLAQVACHVGPHVVLPPIVGGIASLNLCIGLVGPSGAGKDAALAVAAELVGADSISVHEAGTGQGIDASYTAQTKEGPVQYNDTALFVITEIDTLAAHASMNGSTLLPTMRKLYTGSALGAQYADKFKRRPVRAHHYRAAVVAGIQPARSGVLLQDADGGTPQRWVWLPVSDPHAGEALPMRLTAPAPDRWFTQYEAWSPSGEQDEDTPVERKRQIEVRVCDQARQEVIATRVQRLRGDHGADLAGHALLTRLKVGALLGLLDGRAEITIDDWVLAGQIMTKSEETRQHCQNALSENVSRQAAARGRVRAEQEIEMEDTKATAQTQKACRAILTRLRNKGGELVRRDLRGGIEGRLRSMFDESIELLISTGQIRVEQRPDSAAPGGLATWYKAL